PEYGPERRIGSGAPSNRTRPSGRGGVRHAPAKGAAGRAAHIATADKQRRSVKHEIEILEEEAMDDVTRDMRRNREDHYFLKQEQTRLEELRRQSARE